MKKKLDTVCDELVDSIIELQKEIDKNERKGGYCKAYELKEVKRMLKDHLNGLTSIAESSIIENLK